MSTIVDNLGKPHTPVRLRPHRYSKVGSIPSLISLTKASDSPVSVRRWHKAYVTVMPMQRAGKKWSDCFIWLLLPRPIDGPMTSRHMGGSQWHPKEGLIGLPASLQLRH